MDYLHSWFDPDQYHQDSIGRLILLTGATGLVLQYTSILTGMQKYLWNVEDILEEGILEGKDYLGTIADGATDIAGKIEELIEGSTPDSPASPVKMGKPVFTGILPIKYHATADILLWFALLVLLCAFYLLVVKKVKKS